MNNIKLAERISTVSESSTLALTQRAKELQAKGIDLVSFGAGEPKFKIPAHIEQAAINAIKEGKINYTAAGGIPELREAVAERYNSLWGSNYTKKNSIITCGAKHGLFNIAFVLLEPGDEVIVANPYWVTYPEIIRMMGAKPVFVQLSIEDDMILTAEKVLKSITPNTKAIIINTPGNPTGAVIPKEELEQLAKLAVESDIWLIFDECYEKFVFEGEPHVSLAAFDQDVRNHTLLVNAASKTYGLTGLRIGYITGPEEIISAMDKVQGHQTSNPCSVSQYTVLEALKGDQNFLDDLLKLYRDRAQYIYDELSSIDGVRVIKPHGAFYIFPEIIGLMKKGGFKTSSEFVEAMITRAYVSAVPGDGFGMEGYLRFSFVDESSVVEKGIKRFKDFALSL